MAKEDRKGRRINYSRKELAEYLHCAETSVDYRLKKYLIARIFKAEKIKNWDGKYNWQASTLDSMLRNEKYMGDAILQKSYTADFLSKRRVINDGSVQMYHIEEDHEPIIDIETWEAV